MLLADRHNWPDVFDVFVLVFIASSVFGVMLAGHTMMLIDFRRYLRSMRRTLIVVANYLPHVPAWARQQTPRYLVALGLRMPCTEADVLRSYRKKVKRLHPDRGGDQRRFLLLQSDFEQSLLYVREQSARANAR